MYPDRDFGLQHVLPANEATVAQDLELDTLFAAMAAGDQVLSEVARRAIHLSLQDPDTIVYRQQILTDCLSNPTVVRHLYALAGEALQAEKSVWRGLSWDSPRSMLRTSVQKMELLAGFLRRLREMADEHAATFHSPGLTRLLTMFAQELDEQYVALIESQLTALKFRSGLLLSAQLSAGNKGGNHRLRQPRDQRWLARLLDRSGYSFTIPDRDENGFRALGELEDRGVNLVSSALAQSVHHVTGFFEVLRVEIGFYVACLNLSDRLVDKGEPTCFPVALARGDLALRAEGLYDVCLALTVDQRVAANDISADRKPLVIITGANQGGKSTFLRGVGLAQLMMQCGMFVGGHSFRANVCDGLFTHYKREEDDSMRSGKLDEELARMSEIADRITPNCMLLCNESFAATNEREGSQIAREVVHALLDAGVKVLFVTHMFDLACGFYREALDNAVFLRAERGADAARPFKLAEGKPLATSYGEDSYRKIFGHSVNPAAAAFLDRGTR